MSIKLHNTNIFYDCIHKKFVVYVYRLKIKDKTLSWFCSIPILLFIGVVGLLTRLILVVWHVYVFRYIHKTCISRHAMNVLQLDLEIHWCYLIIEIHPLIMCFLCRCWFVDLVTLNIKILGMQRWFVDFVTSNIDICGMQGNNDIFFPLKILNKFIEFLGQMK